MDELAGESDETPCEDILLDENRGRLVFNRGLILRRPVRFLRALAPLLLAHHPFCSQYESHLFSIRGRRVCVGCFFNSVSFFLVLGFLLVGWFMVPSAFNRSYLFWGGAITTLLSFVLSVLNRSENRGVKILSKLMLGSSFAAIVWAVLLADGLETNLELKVGFIVILYLAVVTMLMVKRIAEVEKECNKCEYEMRWSRCPGFKEILCPLVDARFLHPKTQKENSDNA